MNKELIKEFLTNQEEVTLEQMDNFFRMFVNDENVHADVLFDDGAMAITNGNYNRILPIPDCWEFIQINYWLPDHNCTCLVEYLVDGDDLFTPSSIKFEDIGGE